MKRLMAAGMLAMLLGFALLFATAAPSGNVAIGGVVFVGPFPIVFGAGPGGWALGVGSAVVGAIAVVLLILWSRHG